MGYAAITPRVTVRVCAWCEDKVQADAEAHQAGFEVTHGICPTCAARQIAAFLGETQQPPTP